MAVLADKDIRALLNWKGNAPRFETHQAIGIEPCDDSQIQPASVDLTLSNEWRTYPKTANQEGLLIYQTPEQIAIDMDDAKAIETEKTIGEAYLLMPHE